MARTKVEGRNPAPYIIPVFISHQGCPNRCIFCNQASITGHGGDGVGLPSSQWVRKEIEKVLSRPRDPRRQVHVAFYGGSFTGLPTARQEELLGAVAPFRRRGLVERIRLSTRPDYIDADIIALLRAHDVDIVELGIQSMNQDVLDRCRRGHSTAHTYEAVTTLRRAGLTVGAQLMIGLPGETPASLIGGARELAGLGPHFARLYPVIVIKDSELEGMAMRGEYAPLSLGRAVVFAARLREIFLEREIPVIRMGLQPNAHLEKMIISGPHHPAFGELVLARIFFRRVRRILSGKNVEYLLLAAADESVFRGHGNRNTKRLRTLGLLDNVAIGFDSGLCRGEIRAAYTRDRPANSTCLL